MITYIIRSLIPLYIRLLVRISRSFNERLARYYHSNPNSFVSRIFLGDEVSNNQGKRIKNPIVIILDIISSAFITLLLLIVLYGFWEQLHILQKILFIILTIIMSLNNIYFYYGMKFFLYNILFLLVYSLVMLINPLSIIRNSSRIPEYFSGSGSLPWYFFLIIITSMALSLFSALASLQSNDE